MFQTPLNGCTDSKKFKEIASGANQSAIGCNLEDKAGVGFTPKQATRSGSIMGLWAVSDRLQPGGHSGSGLYAKTGHAIRIYNGTVAVSDRLQPGGHSGSGLYAKTGHASRIYNGTVAVKSVPASMK